MLTPFDHLLALILTVLFPIRARIVMYGRLARASEAELPAVRLATYRNAMLVQWSLTAVACALWIFFRRPWRELGLVPFVSGGLIGVLFGLAVVAIVTLRHSSWRTLTDESAAALRRSTEKLARMMPRTDRDLTSFFGLSITAGICEEVLYRGYMIWYLQRLGLALIPAALATSLIFGFGHLYQGWSGMIKTAVVGGFLAAVYLLTGSLFAGMLIHALMDMYAGRQLRLAWSREPSPAVEATA